MKAEVFSHEVFPFFIAALTSLVRCNMTADVFRAIALFITYAYHKPGSGLRTPKVQYGTLPSRSGTPSNTPRRPTLNTFWDGKETPPPPSATLTKRELGNKVLEMYSNILCEKSSTTNIRKFARTVTNKVCRCLLKYIASFSSILVASAPPN